MRLYTLRLVCAYLAAPTPSKVTSKSARESRDGGMLTTSSPELSRQRNIFVPSYEIRKSRGNLPPLIPSCRQASKMTWQD
ncbi:hypothetical protein DFH09DRAFT_1162023 [Mycena vulgaris]|nr:hypothetical protein DFH09DRAFT_1162023 [Mycena vulgaris]